jgi:poly-gamma-glutamate synthesis protein (capsule biosynthesis protein)
VVGIGEDDIEAYGPYRTAVNGQRVAVLGATQVIDEELAAAWTAGPGKPGLASAKDPGRLLAAVRAARSGADTVVVYLHWGLEGAPCPIEPQRTLAALLVDAGADVVVGSHAHVPLGGGWNPDGAYVDYGLGNFVFYAGGNGPNTVSGVLELTVRGRAVTAASWTPARIIGGAPSLLDGAAAGAAVASWDAQRGCAGLAGSPPRAFTG